MSKSFRSWKLAAVVLVVAGFVLLAPWVEALRLPEPKLRFESAVIPDPSLAVAPAVTALELTSLAGPASAAWRSFATTSGGSWDVYLDARSGAPILVQGSGIPVIPGSGNTLQSAKVPTLDSIAATLRAFTARNEAAFLAKDSELTLNREASGQTTPDLWQVVFDRVVAGVPVTGDGLVFHVGHGNLISFGAPRWSTITTDSFPTIDKDQALARVFAHMGLSKEEVALFERATLTFLPITPIGTSSESFAGPVGSGYETALAWRFGFEVAGDPASWVAHVDAHTGEILSLYDGNQYATVKGGVFPVSNNGVCPNGCEQPNFPMPFANVTIGASTQTSSSMGSFSCTPGGSTATTTLNAQYVRVVDNCGAISVSTTCDSDLDLKSSTGTDCAVPAGTSAGNTHSARSSFYHLNRIKEHGRSWLPANAWLQAQLTDNVNINLTCNAFWSPGAGTVNFYRSGGGCGNTGEIAAIFLHEWGHGMSQNDGAGFANPDEAYADVSSFLITHDSCIGAGFFQSSNCSGYGNACLSCTGVREMDWDKRANHAPQTPSNWPASCPSGSGPCSREVHCEAYLAGETLWDLAARDLPGSGVDPQTAWQIVDRLWWVSRAGTSGNAYSCGSPASNRSCAATAWMQQLRVVDDNDGNLANGTPHAAQIFAAFNRHGIPCGAAGDAANQNSNTCPALTAPVVTATGSPGQIALSWTAVPGAVSYNVLRNDQGCNWGHTKVANVPGTSYTDTNLPNGFPMYYAIQAIGASSACTGPLSTCTTGFAGGPHAIYSSNARTGDTCGSGGTGDNDGIYDSGEQISFSVTLRNDGAAPLTGVTATVTLTTPGVTMVDGTATYANLAVATNGTSQAPHFTAQLPTGMACGATLNYDITISSNEGSWLGTFTQTVGQPIVGGGNVLSENFAGGIPGTWTVVNGGTGSGAAATWTTANPGARTFTAPISSPVAIVDSDAAAATDNQDEQLITPVLDLSTAAAVTLDYDEYFRWYNLGGNEIGDVDVRSTLTGGAWVNVVRNQGASSTNPNHRTVNLTAQAAGASDVQLRFHYYQGLDDWYWQVDNVVVSYTAPGGCNHRPCVGSVCGNGTLEAGEQCDDFNTANGDCCSSTCQYEASGGSCGSGESNACTAADTCNGSGTCQPNDAADGSACSDGNACTQSDTCQAGSCAGSNPVVCSPADACHVAGTCNPGTGLCSNPNAPNGTACSDGSACTNGDSCQAGLCSPGAAVSCDDANACTDDSCSAQTGCAYAPNSAACDDGNACTTGDTCDAGACTAGTPVDVNDNNPCTDDSCDPQTGAVFTNNAAPCDDGDACTQGDVCGGGTCGAGTPVVCAASDQCHVAGVCNPTNGLCSDPAAPDGTLCDDANACVAAETCESGVCTGGAPINCDDANACTVDNCFADQGCTHVPGFFGEACNDQNDCTASDACGNDGVCAGVAVAPLGEVTNVQFASTLHQTWNVLPTGGGPTATYDVVRGTLAQFPVGSGTEVCLASSQAASSYDDAVDPATGNGFWYLVRGRNACSAGGYGSATSGPRSSATCP